ncbi:16S rRNA (guanine(966)-N(2))-methyltransferase RsmD [Coraliomargarita sp. SDUM461003]|uniref:16S rRNA (Guanine(966)-N(2))-methyltransferase RsmD n=1 Tax=Thalassobacterium maritimum TaxID=3041265 RepID=A0ABU1AYG8_9BACT|nr:16S rRNA (guanine(966)-N(2))-methyltransferase RsmD [Coraliomargarita sp. SDUM461003]MDQ8209198.1 16S rRNA (guanine(966)-N(2))-methyltransferase RsmD [Coraliomargarita sp. SDUM461003]
MRITGGRARGIPLKAPKGDGTRPATDRMRESVFSSLGPSVEGCRVADLFAGTGSYGLEALSRGAASVSFFETDRAALKCLQENVRAALRSCQLNTEVAKVVSRDVFSLDVNSPAYDLIFLDPPYHIIADEIGRIFTQAVEAIALPEARVILELPGNLEPQIPGWELQRRIGKAGKDKPTAAIFKREYSKGENLNFQT